MSRTAQEVPALIAAVTEHQRFRQLACYSIECLSKVIDPSNRDYEKNLAVAHSCGAGKCVVDVLKRHPGKEEVLLICCESLEKLAVDDANSEVIAGEGCVEAILASLEANPEFPEHVLGQALSILDRLCDHKKSLHILVERESIRSLINVLNKGDQKMEVLVSCLKGMSKLTRVPKAGADFLALKGPSPTVLAMKILTEGVETVLPSTTEQSALFAGITLFIRLLQVSKKDKLSSDDKFKALVEDIKGAGALELCLKIMDKCEDEPLSKACGKLLSLLFDSSSIEELIQSMNDGSLSPELQQHVLHMLASLAVDPASSSDIVRFGGVPLLIKASDENSSVRFLDMSIKALLFLSTNLKNIAQMIEDGVIATLVRTILTPLPVDVGASNLTSMLEIKANAILTLKNICIVQENVPLVCNAGAVGAVNYCLNADILKCDLTLVTNALMFLDILVNSIQEGSDRIVASNGSSNGLLLQYISVNDTSIISSAMKRFSLDVNINLTGLRVLYDLCISTLDHAVSLISDDIVGDILAIMCEFGQENTSLLHVCLHLLWTLLLASTDKVSASISSAHNSTGTDVVLGCIGHKIRVDPIRRVGVKVIGLLASESLVKKVIAKLNKIAHIPIGDLSIDSIGNLTLVAITIGVLAMVPEYLSKIFSLGGVAPMIHLLSNVLLIPFDGGSMGESANEGDSNVYHEAVQSLCSALEEIISSSNILEVPNLLETIIACVNALQKHSKLLVIVQSALHLLAVISASSELTHKKLCIDQNVLEAIGNILRINPFNSKIVFSIAKIYSNLTDCEDEVAIVICRRNASKNILGCIEKNLSQLAVDGVTQPDSCGVINSRKVEAQMICVFMPILFRLSTIIPEGRDILRRQGALNCLCDIFERFLTLQAVKGKYHIDRDDIREWCLKIIQVLLEEADIHDTLQSLDKKKKNTRPGLFSLTDRSVDNLNAASRDVSRLGLLMLCGNQVVCQIENAGGFTLLYECLYNFSPAVNTSVCESSLVSRAREKFVTYCIEALGRGALGNMDITTTIAIIPLLVAAAISHPTEAVFIAMTRLGCLSDSVIQVLVDEGAVQACLTICQADIDAYSSEVVSAAFSCLALLAKSDKGLALIVQNNAVHLICQFICESLDMFEEDRELSTDMSVLPDLSSIRSALDTLLSLVTNHDTTVSGNINVDILKVICQLIDEFVKLSALSWEQSSQEKSTTASFVLDVGDDIDESKGIEYDGQNSSKTFEVPDLLAVTMSIVKALIEGHMGDEYCTALIERLAIKKLDSLMFTNNDAYLHVLKTTDAMAHLWTVLVVDVRSNTNSVPPPPPDGRSSVVDDPCFYNQSDSRKYVEVLQSRDYILRAMNYHAQDMDLQKLLARIISCLGMEGGATGLIALVEQANEILSKLNDSDLGQLTQVVQLIGNLLLVEGMLSQDVGDSLFQMLLKACKQLQELQPSSVASECRADALKNCFMCLNKLLAIDDASAFCLSDPNIEVLLYFIKMALENSDTDRSTKLNLLHLLREVIDKTSSVNSGTFVATVLCLSINMTEVLLMMNVDETSGSRFGRGADGAASDIESLKQQQINTLETLFNTIFLQQQVAYLLYNENGYMHVSTICNLFCSPLCHNYPSSALHFKKILKLFIDETWAAYFGPYYLLALLADLLQSDDNFLPLRSTNAVNLIREEILLMLTDSINGGVLTVIEDPSWVAGLITAIAFEIQGLGGQKDHAAVAASEAQLFTLLTALADSPAGARGISLNSTVSTWLLEKLVKINSTTSASNVVTKMLFHEDMEIIEALVEKKLTKRILMSLKSAGMKDEDLAQNALYLLRVLGDLLQISSLELPKDTIALLDNLIYTYSHNEYLVGVAKSLKSDLLEIYAVGPEAQLEQLLDSVPSVHMGADGWIQTPDESGNVYYYNNSDGVSQWEEPEGYSLLSHTINGVIDIACTTLNENLSNVALTEQHVVDFYQILIYQGNDSILPKKVMQFLYAQATKSGSESRDILKALPEDHVDVIVTSLHNQVERISTSDGDGEMDLVAVERSFELFDHLLLLSNFKEKLSSDEYIKLLCEACRKFVTHPLVLCKILAALGRLIRKSVELVLISFKYEFHIIMGEIVDYQSNQLPTESSSSWDDFLDFLSEVDKNGDSVTMRQTLGVGGAAVSTLDVNSSNGFEQSVLMPALNLCNLLLSLYNTLLTLDNYDITSTLSVHCFSSVLRVGINFMSSPLMVNRHVHLISRFAAQHFCLRTIVTPATVSHLVRVINFHIDNISLISTALVLFSDFSAIEQQDNEGEADEGNDRFNASSVILKGGGFTLVGKVMQAHINKAEVLTVCFGVVYNLVEPDSAPFFTSSEESATELNLFYEVVFTVLNRYDFNHELVLSTLQAALQFTSNDIAIDCVFGNVSFGRSRWTLLLDMCQSFVSIKSTQSNEQVDEEPKEEENEDGELDDIIHSILELFNSTLAVPETSLLLQTANDQDSEAVEVVLQVLSCYSSSTEITSSCLTFLLTVTDINDNLSRNVGEKGSLLFVNLVETHMENTPVVSLIFQLFGRLVFVKQNLMSFVQHKGIGILLTAMQVFGEDPELVTSAVTTLGNIVSSDEESSNLVLEAGGEAAVEKVQNSEAFQPGADFPEVHSSARSALLAISARLRAKGRIGTKTNVGTLLSRIGQDVDSVVNSEQDKVKESKLNLNMSDPLLPAYRSALKSGQNVTDYVKGSTFSRKLWLTSDCAHLILKEDTNNIKKLGRKIKLRSIAEVHKGYGPGHYKSSLFGGKKTKAKEAHCLYLSVNEQAGADDAITIEFANASDCDKWFDVFRALLLASVSCPHFLEQL